MLSFSLPSNHYLLPATFNFSILYPMKPQLIIFAILIAGFIIYNFFLQSQDDRTNTVINIIFASLLFGYISFMAYSLLKKMKK